VLAEIVPGRRLVVLGVGNRARRDDGAGSVLAERLRQRLTGRLARAVIDAGVAPENYLEKAAREHPDGVLMADAADLGAPPGTCRVLPLEALAHAGLSSHALSVGLAARYLEARTGARVQVLAIQPCTVAPGDTLSGAVSEAVDGLATRLARLMTQRSLR
jgi:hydrogenase 3 maturation protease